MAAVDSYLSETTLAAIDRPVEAATGLPNEAYTSEEYFALERDRLFARTWTVIGVASEIPAPGDVKPFQVLGIPLLALRDRAGAVKVFHNVCSHRGQRLVTRPCRVTGSLQCPYHAWTYGLDGKLLITPSFGGHGKDEIAGFDKSRHGLAPVRSGVWRDMIFVDLSDRAAPLDRHLAPLKALWRDYDLDSLGHGATGAGFDLDVAANWKLGVENNLEAYHLPWVHPNLNSYSGLDQHYCIFGDHLFSGLAARSYAPQDVNGQHLPPFPGLSEEARGGATYPTLYPNVFLGMMPDHAWTLVLEPLAANRTREHMHIYYIGEAATDPAYAETREVVCARWREIIDEDIWAMEGLQIGRHSPAYKGGVFSPTLEAATHHFHRWAAHMVADAAA